MPFVLKTPPPGKCLRTLPRELMERYCVFPVALDETANRLSVAMPDIYDYDLVADLQMASGMLVVPVEADTSNILEWIATFVEKDSKFKANGRQAGSSPVIRLVDEIIQEAMHSGVSDIHFEPGERSYNVRFRKDGVLSVLIYAAPQGSEADLYVYNQETDTMRLYQPGQMILRSSLILTVAEKPDTVVVPEGFSPTKITYGSTEIDGYVSKDGSTRIAYLRSEDGTAKFYVIDSSGKDFYPYKAPSTHRNLFLYLFIICASIAVVEALIIGILFYRRRIAYRRQVKPRRV